MNAIVEAHSIQQAVEVINLAAKQSVPYFGGTDCRTPDEMAGEYALEAAEETGYTDDASIEAHLELLIAHGARFDVLKAMESAIARR